MQHLITISVLLDDVSQFKVQNVILHFITIVGMSQTLAIPFFLLTKTDQAFSG